MDDSHAVILHLKLQGGQFGSERERDAIHEMTDRLEAAIIAADAGEFDGDEFGGNGCTVYMYGPDAEKLYAAIRPVLDDWPQLAGGYAIKRFGPPGAREQRIDFGLN